jgi:hypothetical protein
MGVTMGWGFEIGRTYNRRTDIHGRFGGQQQGGIITPAQHPLVIIITGRDSPTIMCRACGAESPTISDICSIN